MASFDITEGITTGLGAVAGSVSSYTNTGFLYNFAVAGLPFLSAIRDDTPLERGFAQVRRQQLDTAQVAGEQSLSNWWLRSQFTFTGGAGQQLFEPAQDETVRGRFKQSQGVDCWTEGQVSLLPAVASIATTTSGNLVAGAVSGSTSYTVWANGTTTYVWNGTSNTAVTGLTGVSTWLWPVGDRVLSGYSAGIDIINVSAGTAVNIYNSASAAVRCWFVKNRIIAASGKSLYELAYKESGATSVGTALTGTVNASGWTWTGCVETPDAILVSGYSGSKGAIYKLTVSESNGTLPVMTSPIVVAEFPHGEVPTGMISYLGTYVAIGTNKGVRIATASAGGQFQLGALTVETTSSVQHFTAKDRFIYAGVTAGQLDGTSGVVRIDLSAPDQQGRYPYAFDISTTDTTAVSGVTQHGSTGGIVVASGAVWVASATVKVASGYLDTSDVLYGTLEPKQFYYATVKATFPGGTLNLSQIVDGTVSSLIDYSTTNANEDTQPSQSAISKMGLRFTLARDGSDTTLGPTVTGWQLKALPVITRQELIKVPLLCYDTERDSAGNKSTSDAWTRYSALVAAVENVATTTFQNLDTGELVTGVVEDLSFTQTSPPKGFGGFGGIITFTLRVV